MIETAKGTREIEVRMRSKTGLARKDRKMRSNVTARIGRRTRNTIPMISMVVQNIVVDDVVILLFVNY